MRGRGTVATELHAKRVDLRSYEQVFWDFDGVIKDSVTVKSDAFEQLFLPFGNELGARVRAHHEEHSGVSRFDKIPVYLGWAGEVNDEATVQEYSLRFSQMVKSKVIDSAWIPGVHEYLLRNADRQQFSLVTATPHNEILEILAALNLASVFRQVFGAPTSKKDGIASVLKESGAEPSNAVMIGDARSDYEAAMSNGIGFVLRRTITNAGLQRDLVCPMIDDFLN